MPKKQSKKKGKSSKRAEETTKTEFTIERTYNASITKVWNALTRSDELKQWYLDLPDFKPIKGFEFTFMLGKDPDNLYKHQCKITDVIPGKKLAYSWQYEGYEGNSEVIYELFEEGKKTKVKLTHKGINTFPEDNEDLSANNFAEGWTFIVGKALKEYAEKRKIILFNLITVDGFFEGLDGDISWHQVDDEFNESAIKQLNSMDALIFGRKTYEMMASYWPTEYAIKNDPIVAKLMNDMPKFVFSKSLKEVKWSNSSLISGDIKTAVVDLKEKFFNDIYIFGSGKLTNEFLKLGLIDEIRLIINPILLGKGTHMFSNNGDKLTLQFLKSTTFKNGNIGLIYKVILD